MFEILERQTLNLLPLKYLFSLEHSYLPPFQLEQNCTTEILVMRNPLNPDKAQTWCPQGCSEFIHARRCSVVLRLALVSNKSLDAYHAEMDQNPHVYLQSFTVLSQAAGALRRKKEEENSEKQGFTKKIKIPNSINQYLRHTTLYADPALFGLSDCFLRVWLGFGVGFFLTPQCLEHVKNLTYLLQGLKNVFSL